MVKCQLKSKSACRLGMVSLATISSWSVNLQGRRLGGGCGIGIDISFSFNPCYKLLFSFPCLNQEKILRDYKKEEEKERQQQQRVKKPMTTLILKLRTWTVDHVP